MIPPAPPWVDDAIRFVYRIRPHVRIRALRLSEQQWAELAAWVQQTPDKLWGIPVVRR